MTTRLAKTHQVTDCTAMCENILAYILPYIFI